MSPGGYTKRNFTTGELFTAKHVGGSRKYPVYEVFRMSDGEYAAGPFTDWKHAQLAVDELAGPQEEKPQGDPPKRRSDDFAPVRVMGEPS